MSKKEDVNIVRAGEFQQVDEDLTLAMQELDKANLRIEELLQSRDATLPEDQTGTEDERDKDDAAKPAEDASGTATKTTES